MESDEFARAHAAWRWRAIRNCPGRWVCDEHERVPTLEDIVGTDARIERIERGPGRDVVLVVRFEHGGGVISYLRDDGTLVHTLNDAAGLRRKLDDFADERS